MCAFCLSSLPLTSITKICEKCFKVHNFSQKYSSFGVDKIIQERQDLTKELNESIIERSCNLCKKLFENSRLLGEHLIEHSFQGCNERGFTCYICSSVFTSASGLHQHMIGHGPDARPYDCNRCNEKFFFQIELENHIFNHDNGRIKSPNSLKQIIDLNIEKNENENVSNECNTVDTIDVKNEQMNDEISEQKIENNQDDEDDDDEYIEIEKICEQNVNENETKSDDEKSTKSNDVQIHDDDEKPNGNEETE